MNGNITMLIKSPICWIRGHNWSKTSKPKNCGLELLLIPFMVLSRMSIPEFRIHTCERCGKEKQVQVNAS